jgi:hypothetical protein
MLGFDISERTISRWMRRTPRDLSAISLDIGISPSYPGVTVYSRASVFRNAVKRLRPSAPGATRLRPMPRPASTRRTTQLISTGSLRFNCAVKAVPTKTRLDILMNIPSRPILQTRRFTTFSPNPIFKDPSKWYRGDLRLSLMIRLDLPFMEFCRSRTQVLPEALIIVEPLRPHHLLCHVQHHSQVTCVHAAE